MTPSQQQKAAQKWNLGHGTAAIARYLEVPEHEVYNDLNRIRFIARYYKKRREAQQAAGGQK